MSAIAHISGAPVEELLQLACGGALLWPALRALTTRKAGRNENGPGHPMSWVRRRDEYEAGAA